MSTGHKAAAARHFGPIKVMQGRLKRLGDTTLIRQFIALHDRLCGERTLPRVDLLAISSYDAMGYVLRLRGYDVEHLISNDGRERFGCPKLKLGNTIAKIRALIASQAIDEQYNAHVAREISDQ